MKKPWIIDIVFMLVLAVALVFLNETGLVSLAHYRYIYLGLLIAYFTGRKIGAWTESKKS